MTVETFIRIAAFVLVGGWLAFTLPSLVTGRWRLGDRVLRWPQLPEQRRADIVRNACAMAIFGAGAALAPDRKLGIVPALAIVLPGLLLWLWRSRIDFGNNHILRGERPGDYWMIVTVGTVASAGCLWLLFWPAVTAA